MTCDAWEVVAVPFPFTDRSGQKRRPALILSPRRFNAEGHSVMAMMTTKRHAPWPGDTSIANLDAAGLRTACIVRLKIFTLDNRLIVRRIGSLAAPDKKAIRASVRQHLW
ncbi:MAG: type II toxin-antitoxin system PemK/MazF family toxin [Luteitalea sp.]|nr:type II toxin-antitoxin system PemK/MazF family toxin [Luteitalea sp.]